MPGMDDVQQQLAASREQAFDDLKQLLSIPSISADSRHKGDCRKAAEWILGYLTKCGLTTELVETPGHPIIYAEWTGAPGQPTALVYGHYDVQPPDPLDLWTSPPFEPTVRDGKLFARGSTDDKGQLFTHIRSVATWMKVCGKLPINVKFVIEGEEEVGSKNLENFLNARKTELACDVAVISDTAQYGDGIPAITYGLRGIIACEVMLRGPNRDLHSGVFGGSVANPITQLARLIAIFHDNYGRVQIPGFYDDVIPLTGEERVNWAQLPFEESEYMASLGVKALWGEEGYTTTERRWARPTCEINGITGGYQGEGPKTIVPSKASCKITCRLVPDQDPHKVTEALEKFLRDNCPPDVQLEFKSYHGAPASVCDVNSPWMSAARQAITQGFGREPVLIREGGSIPVVGSFKQILGVDTLLLGWGRNTDNLHSPDEHIQLADFHHGTAASAALWQAMATSST